jgi:endoglucanase
MKYAPRTRLLSPPVPWRSGNAVAVGALSVGMGIALLAVILAAGTYAVANLDDGVTSGNAKIVTASGASGGEAVQFSASAPTPSPNGYPTSLYINPNSDAATQAAAWSSSDPADADEMRKIAGEPTASWFGDWDTNVESDVTSVVNAAAASHTLPVLVTYDIPFRDCGGYSAGGATDATYASWISSFAAGIGSQPAIVIVEPDALAGISCLSSAEQSIRLSLISSAVATIKSHSGVRVYLDAGNPGWQPAATIAHTLNSADIAGADGFSINVSNFYTTAQNVTYGQQVAALVGGKHFVIDTSRNGRGSDGQWCNPPGMALGEAPTLSTGVNGADAYLWIKYPGESDGTCNGGPAAGAWWPSYALSLAQNAAF